MRRIRRIEIMILALLAVAAPSAVAADVTEEDPWKGKPRSAIVELLGEPQRVKKRGLDGETLTYKVYRVDPSAMGSIGLRMIPLPGVGVVGVKPPNTPGDLYVTGRGPNDSASGPYGPGESNAGPHDPASETITRSYDSESGEWETTGGDPGAASTRGKLKLVFVLDADGRVKEWSVPGKK